MIKSILLVLFLLNALIFASEGDVYHNAFHDKETNLDIDSDENQLLVNPFNFLFKESNVSIIEMQGINNEITSLTLCIDRPFYGNVFSKFFPLVNSDNSKEIIKILYDAIAFMMKEKIPLNFIVEGVQKPSDIQKLQDSKFYLTYRNIKILIDIQTKEVITLEKI